MVKITQLILLQITAKDRDVSQTEIICLTQDVIWNVATSEECEMFLSEIIVIQSLSELSNGKMSIFP